MLKNNDALEIFRIFPFFTCTLIKDFNADVDMKLNHTEEKTLIAISQKKNKTMSFYSRMAGLEKGSFTATVDELRDKGLIERTTHQYDKRKTILVLTKKGEELAREIKKQFKIHLNKLFSELSYSEREELSKAIVTLKKIVRKLEDTDS